MGVRKFGFKDTFTITYHTDIVQLQFLMLSKNNFTNWMRNDYQILGAYWVDHGSLLAEAVFVVACCDTCLYLTWHFTTLMLGRL